MVLGANHDIVENIAFFVITGVYAACGCWTRAHDARTQMFNQSFVCLICFLEMNLVRQVTSKLVDWHLQRHFHWPLFWPVERFRLSWKYTLYFTQPSVPLQGPWTTSKLTWFVLSSEWKRENKASGQTDWLTDFRWMKAKIREGNFCWEFLFTRPCDHWSLACEKEEKTKLLFRFWSRWYSLELWSLLANLERSCHHFLFYFYCLETAFTTSPSSSIPCLNLIKDNFLFFISIKSNYKVNRPGGPMTRNGPLVTKNIFPESCCP